MVANLSVPFVALDRQYAEISEALEGLFRKIGKSGNYILGEYVQKFEEEVAEYCHCKHAIAVANGSDALFLSLKALGIGPGDEVITTSNSFIASAWVVKAAGADLIFADIGDDLNIDPEDLLRRLTVRTKAIIPVHLTGQPAKMLEIRELATSRKIAVLEDAAQAIGGEIDGQRVGSFGDAAGFSLHPLKNLGVIGDGGFITTNSSSLMEQIRLLRNHGLEHRDSAVIWGYNSRLDSLQAAIASEKLKRLPTWNSRVKAIANFYHSRISQHVRVPHVPSNVNHVYHNFVIRTPLRDQLKLHLKSLGVETAIHYPVPIHLQHVGRGLGYGEGSLPKTEKYAGEILSLPIFPQMTDLEVETVAESVVKFFT